MKDLKQKLDQKFDKSSVSNRVFLIMELTTAELIIFGKSHCNPSSVARSELDEVHIACSVKSVLTSLLLRGMQV